MPLARQHFAPQCSALGAGPNAAPGILRRTLVENDAAAERDGQARGRGDADSSDGLRAYLPQHAVGLTIFDDLDDAGVSHPPAIHAVRVIGTGDRPGGLRIADA